jgi:hypothetical protein
MSLSTHEIGLDALDGLSKVDAICLFVAEDERPLRGTAGFVDWRLCGELSRVLQKGFFTGVQNDWLLVPSRGRLPAPRIFVGGIGRAKQLTPLTLGAALESAARTLAKARSAGVAIEVPGAGALDEQARAAALTNGFLPGFSGHVAVLADKGLARLLPAR